MKKLDSKIVASIITAIASVIVAIITGVFSIIAVHNILGLMYLSFLCLSL